MNKQTDSHQEIHNCREMASKPMSFFFQQGSTDAGKKILILGESLAKTGWVESGRAFYTKEGKIVPTGKRLNEELAIVNIAVEECAFTEIAKCYIGKNRKQLAACGLLCSEHLLRQVDHFKPSVIVSLGVITKDVLNEIFKADLVMGEIGAVTNRDKAYAILPLFHPSPANPYGHAKNMGIIGAQREALRSMIS